MAPKRKNRCRAPSSEEAPHIIDGLLYHETDLEIEEHYPDAAGFVDHVFAMCHMLGFRFAPRIKTFSKNKIYTFEKPVNQPHLEFMIGGAIHTKKIRENWDDLLRLTSSVRNGTVTASLILKKLAAYPRQNSLSVTLRESCNGCNTWNFYYVFNRFLIGHLRGDCSIYSPGWDN
ncbi:hypothetical protein ABD98_02705 [Bacillus mycoides]|nr:hypothetical protein [Bacillus mycoides]